MGTPKATSILWPKGAPHPQTWVPPQLQLNRERGSPLGVLGGSVSCTCLLHAEESEHKLFTVFTSTVPHQTKANTTGGPSSREKAREAVSVCVCMGGCPRV